VIDEGEVGRRIAKLEAKNPNDPRIDELDALSDYLYTFLFMYGSNIFRDEGVKVDLAGNFTLSDSDAASSERNDYDTTDEDDEDESEQVVTTFGVSDQNKSITTKLVPTVKSLLRTMRTGRMDKYGYGLWSYVSVPDAVNKLLKVCEGCDTFAEMLAVMKRNQRSVPWMGQLVSVLEITGNDTISTSKKEQLQTMFYQSFRKQFTLMRHTMQQIDKDGNIVYVGYDSNRNELQRKYINQIRSSYWRKTGLLFDHGELNFNKLNDVRAALGMPATRSAKVSTSSLLNKILGVSGKAKNIAAAAARQRQTQKPSYEDLYAEMREYTKQVKSALTMLGINVSDKILEEYLSNQPASAAQSNSFGAAANWGDENLMLATRRLTTLITSINSLVSELDKWGEFQNDKGIVETNPYRKSVYPNIYRVTGGYEKLVATLLEFHTDANESMAYANGKRYYSWNNPSTIGSIIEKFRGNPDKMRAYIRDKYTQDKLWYLRQGSTEADMQFYSDLLNDLYNGHGDPRQLIEYSEVIGFNGEKYEQMSDMSYAMQMLNDFFTPESTPTGPKNTRAWYRMLIAGDKPRYATVRFRRYAEEDAHYDEEFGKVIYGDKDYHRILENKALDYLTQEILRSESVIRYAAKHRGPKVNGYDVDRRDARFKHVFDKIANDEPVTIEDVVKDGNYIFKGTGAAFYFNRFINNEIEQGTDLGRYIVDRIFNTHLQKDTRRVIDPMLIPAFTDAFHNYMQEILDHNFNSLLEMGMFAEQFRKGDEESGATKHLKYLRGNMIAWNAANPQFRVTMYRENAAGAEAMAERFGVDLSKEPAERTFFAELAYFRYMLENYVYNNWYAKVEMAQVFDVDLAFYGDTTNFQKRNAQVVSSGMTTDPDARIHGELVSDGKYRSVTIKTHKVPSEYLDNIEAVLNRWRNKISDPVRQAQFWKGAKDTLGKLGKIDPTDGQAFVGLTALRKRLAGQGQWSRSNTKQIDTDGYYVDENGRKIYVYTDEAVYQRMKKAYAGVPDEVRINDFQHVFSQVQKDFVYTFDHMDRAERGKVTVPVQHKNSEYALVFLSAFTALEEPESQLAGISRFLEETAKADIRKGIDTVNFDSAVKIGGTSEAIDLYGMDGQQTYQALMKQVYGSGVDGYRPGFVTTYDNRDYKIVQEKPEHFKRNAQPMGSQLKILAINNISDNTSITLPSGETITGKQLKARYFEALRRKVQGVERDFRREYGIGRPMAWRIHSLSNAIKTAMGTDARYSVEMRRALSITERNGEDRFVMPLDDPSQQAAIEAMLYSKIRRLYYRQKTNGGIVVQATSWGAEGKKLKSLDAVPDLAIRFYSANPEDIEKHGGILRTKREFAAQNPNLSGAQLDAAYKQYTQTYQQGYAYFEAEVPMPDYVRKMIANRDGTIDRKYYNADGSWNMDAIKEVVPDSAFDAICYRVPTEAKYSIMVARVVRFSKEGSGSTAKYPLEITEFTGSDFDIDTTTIELRPGPAQKSSRGVDDELFDLQLGALRSDPAIQETFKSGDFSDLQEESYYTRLLEDPNLNMSPEELDKLSPKELKALCMQVEDLDLFDPMTDILLHNQNADAGQMIGIAAVGVTSHAFYSLYNDVNLDDPKRNPLTSPENFLRIVVQEADG
ncbi:MAG: hypothetical protein II661_07515, partial [Bacteroidales bacterium]|nr:hypothetical protein [Bacteroidales bacterium]